MHEFDIVSHYAAILPIALAYYYDLNFLAAFTSFAVFVSLVHHADPDNDIWMCVDIFFSSSLIIIGYFVYIVNMRIAFLAPIFSLLFFFTFISVFVRVDVVTYFMAFLILCAAGSFTYDRQVKKMTSEIYDVSHAYFISFVVTQLLAVYFYLKAGYDDNDKYSHSFWHVFAFTSLASLIVHISPKRNKELDKILFYWLGSVPCRLFISWVFIDWDQAEKAQSSPILGIFIIITIIVLGGIRFSALRIINDLLYVAVCVYIGMGDMMNAGVLLLCSTFVSVADKIVLYNSVRDEKEVVSSEQVDETNKDTVSLRF